jgi:hypothetical protein
MTKQSGESQKNRSIEPADPSLSQDKNQSHGMGKTFPDLIHDFFLTSRGLISIGILLSLVTVSLACIILLASKNKTKIQVTSEGATLFQVDGRDQSAVFLLRLFWV